MKMLTILIMFLGFSFNAQAADTDLNVLRFNINASVARSCAFVPTTALCQNSAAFKDVGTARELSQLVIEHLKSLVPVLEANTASKQYWEIRFSISEIIVALDKFDAATLAAYEVYLEPMN